MSDARIDKQDMLMVDIMLLLASAIRVRLTFPKTPSTRARSLLSPSTEE